jgi:hypothetical protein
MSRAGGRKRRREPSQAQAAGVKPRPIGDNRGMATTWSRPKSLRLRRRWLVLAAGLLVLAAFPFVWAGRRTFAVRREVNAGVAELDRTDPRWRLDEIEADRARVPDGENSAPLILRIRTVTPRADLDPEAAEVRERLVDGELPPAVRNTAGDPTDARLRQGKPGKGGSDVGRIEETFRRNPVGHRAHPVESGQHPEASLASWQATARAKRRQRVSRAGPSSPEIRSHRGSPCRARMRGPRLPSCTGLGGRSRRGLEKSARPPRGSPGTWEACLFPPSLSAVRVSRSQWTRALRLPASRAGSEIIAGARR